MGVMSVNAMRKFSAFITRIERLEAMKNTLSTMAFVLLASMALAHSSLEETVPGDGANLTVLPTEFVFVFAHKIRLTRVVWTLDGNQTSPIDLSTVDGFATEFTLPFEGAGPGTYQIEWRGLGDDGHPQTGGFGFKVE